MNIFTANQRLNYLSFLGTGFVLQSYDYHILYDNLSQTDLMI